MERSSVVTKMAKKSKRAENIEMAEKAKMAEMTEHKKAHDQVLIRSSGMAICVIEFALLRYSVCFARF